MSAKFKTVEEYHEVLKKFAPARGLIFNPDESVVLPLVEGLLKNMNRYGFPTCPCRLACGDFHLIKDIVCPCEYAEPDIEQFGQCYCGLYVSEAFAKGEVENVHVPERRPAEKQCY